MKMRQGYFVVVALIAGFVGGLLFVGILSLRTMGRSGEVLEAQTFRLVDKRGNARGELTAMDGSAALVFTDKNGDRRVTIGIFPNGTAGLALVDVAGTTRAFFSQGAIGAPMLSFRDSRERIRLLMSSSPEASGLLIQGRSGGDTGFFGQITDQPPALNITNEKGDIIWSAP